MLLKERRVRRLGDLTTPEKIQNLRQQLHQKAKDEPSFRFYTLYDKVYRRDILSHAYELAKEKGGSAGVDGLTFKDIEKDGGLEPFLRKLEEELKTETYQPMPLRRVFIPKADGGQRPLGIPTIRDRVAQGAALLVLEPIFEADMPPNAYAYRAELSAHDAIKHVHRLLREGYVDVVDADLSKYFDTIPHSELLKSVARRVSDGKILKLIKLWLKMPAEERTEKGRRKLTGGGGRGTPQGGVISPLLANIYMRRFLLAWEKWGLPKKLRAHVVNYADDFVILCRRTADRARGVAEKIIEGMKLTMNAQKTRTVNAWKEPFNFLGYTFGPCFEPRGAQIYLGAKPERKRLLRFDRANQELLKKLWVDAENEVIAALNRRLIGWVGYYSYGTLSDAYRMADRLTARRVRTWLCRRYRVETRGTRQFPEEELYSKYWLFSLRAWLSTRRQQAYGKAQSESRMREIRTSGSMSGRWKRR